MNIEKCDIIANKYVSNVLYTEWHKDLQFLSIRGQNKKTYGSGFFELDLYCSDSI